MKKRYHKIGKIALFVLCMVLCWNMGMKTKAAGFNPRDYNTFDKALEVSIAPENDYYAVENSFNGQCIHYIKITTEAYKASIFFVKEADKALSVKVYDKNRNYIGDLSNYTYDVNDIEDDLYGMVDYNGIQIPALSEERIYNVGQNNGGGYMLDAKSTYYLEIDAGKGFDYVFELEKFADATPSGFENAKQISVGKKTDANTSSYAGAVHSYKFTTKSNDGFYRVKFTNAYNTKVKLAIYDNNKKLVKSYTASNKKNLNTDYLKLSKKSLYYVLITCEEAGITYNLLVSGIDDEAGDSFAKAGSLSLGSKKTCAIQVEEDVDYLKFVTAKDVSKYTISTQTSSGAKVALYDKNKKKISYTSGKTITLSKNSMYYFKVYGAASGTATVQVKAVPADKIKKITLNKKSLVLKVGKKYRLKIKTKTPSNASKKKILWKSNRPKIAKVSSSGRVTAKKKGNAVITCTFISKDGTKKRATCKVKVKKK